MDSTNSASADAKRFIRPQLMLPAITQQELERSQKVLLSECFWGTVVSKATNSGSTHSDSRREAGLSMGCCYGGDLRANCSTLLVEVVRISIDDSKHCYNYVVSRCCCSN